MARYIKFEDAINAIKQYAIDAYSIDLECTEQFAGSRPEERFCEGLFEAIGVLDEVPTADVAPRSEVAREIFAEIEKMLEDQEVVAKNPREKELGDWIFHHYIPRKITKLKKKRTEEPNV